MLLRDVAGSVLPLCLDGLPDQGRAVRFIRTGINERDLNHAYGTASNVAVPNRFLTTYLLL